MLDRIFELEQEDRGNILFIIIIIMAKKTIYKSLPKTAMANMNLFGGYLLAPHQPDEIQVKSYEEEKITSKWENLDFITHNYISILIIICTYRLKS